MNVSGVRFLSRVICIGTLLSFSVTAQAQTPAIPIVAGNPAAHTTVTSVSSVPRGSCFPLEKLPASLRAPADKLLLSLLDSEALYTMIGGMKPMSSGFANYKININDPKTGTLDEVRRMMATFRCGDYFYADVLPFHQPQKDMRFFDAAVFNRPAVQAMITQYPEFFSPYGITPTTEPIAVAILIENDPTSARNRGLGYLYGYPKRAVDFFVASTDEQEKTKKLVPRDFMQIPTFKRETGTFVYAVPKGSDRTQEDNALKEKAARILAAYKERRQLYIGEGKPGAAALIRDWFDDGSGQCAPKNAKY